MFVNAGFSAATFDVGNFSGWNTSNVTNMSGMFYGMASNVSSLKLNLANWNTSKVTDMSDMFRSLGENATTWSVGNLAKKTVSANGTSYTAWNTSSVTNMSNMFNCAGKKASYSLNVSSWNVGKVTNYTGFDAAVESKVIDPWQ